MPMLLIDTDDVTARRLGQRRRDGATGVNQDDPTQPDYVRPELMAALPDLQLMDDLLHGTRRMWRRASAYISKWPDEEASTYQRRSQGETLFGGLKRTIGAGVGMLFAKAPSVEWGPAEARMMPLWDNLDAQGTKGSVFAKRFAQAALRDGLCLLLVDFPPRPTGVTVTAANEQALGLRPIWAMYPRHQIINWRVETVQNQRVLTLVVLHELADVPDGPYGTVLRDRYRVLYLDETGAAAWRLYQRRELVGGAGVERGVMPITNQDGAAFDLIAEGRFLNARGEARSSLPVAVAYTGTTDTPMVVDPPLLDVAWANLAHWQLATDLRFNSVVAGFEQLVVSGSLLGSVDPDTGMQVPGKLRVGPLVAINVENGGAVQWISPAGGGLAQLKERVLEKLAAMAQQGLSFLQTDTRAAETAEAKRLDASAENATLATAAQAIEDAINLAWENTAWYDGLERQAAPVITLSRDYESTAMTAQLLTAYVQAVATAGLPVRLLLAKMQQGGLIGADEDLDAMEADILANQAAIADAEAERLAMQAGREQDMDPTTSET